MNRRANRRAGRGLGEVNVFFRADLDTLDKVRLAPNQARDLPG